MEFANLWDSDFSSRYPSWILNEFSKRPKLLSGFSGLNGFYVNWRRTCHLGPFLQQPLPDFYYFVTLHKKFLLPEHWNQNCGFVCTVTIDKTLHLVCYWFCICKRTNAKTSEDDRFGQKRFQAPTQMNYWTHPASQPAFRFPSKHLSHLWLDPCCLDTVHAVVIGPYPNQ